MYHKAKADKTEDYDIFETKTDKQHRGITGTTPASTTTVTYTPNSLSDLPLYIKEITRYHDDGSYKETINPCTATTICLDVKSQFVITKEINGIKYYGLTGGDGTGNLQIKGAEATTWQYNYFTSSDNQWPARNGVDGLDILFVNGEGLYSMNRNEAAPVAVTFYLLHPTDTNCRPLEVTRSKQTAAGDRAVTDRFYYSTRKFVTFPLTFTKDIPAQNVYSWIND